MPVKHQLGKIIQTTELYPFARDLYKRIDPKRSFYPKRKENLGEILSFENVTVVPYESLLERFSGLSIHKGGPIWPNWSKQIEARHCRNLSPVDNRPTPPKDIAETIEEPVIWGGAICHHFGHQVADFCTRIVHAKAVHPQAKFLFAAKSSDRIETLEQTPHFFRSILDWYGLEQSQIKIVSRPILAKRLLVSPQAEQLSNYGPSADYLDLMDARISTKQMAPRTHHEAIYVSRAGLRNCFAGESYVESLMHKAGIKVVRPETQPLSKQLAEYRASERLIFSAGSAIHGLQLLGRLQVNVQVINRRPRGRLAKNIIEPRVSSLTYLDSIHKVLHGFTPTGLINDWDGITIHKEERLLSSFQSINLKLKQYWNSEIYAEHRDRDVSAWIKREGQPGKSLHSLPAYKLSSQLRKAGLSHIPFRSEAADQIESVNH